METSGSSVTCDQVQRDLYFLIAQFLSAGPCTESAKVLQKELEEHNLIASRLDYCGVQHKRSFAEFAQLFSTLPSDYLLRICRQIGPVLNDICPPAVRGLQTSCSLLGRGKQSLLRSKESRQHVEWTLPNLSAKYGASLVPPNDIKRRTHLNRVVHAREISGAKFVSQINDPHFHGSRIHLQTRIWGHLHSVFCVAFDKSGNYIVTGADDKLVKVWSASDGRLLFSFRGSAGEITDLSINHENTLLAAGNTDRTIRVWSLQNGEPIAVLQGHTATITQLQFLPYVNGSSRFLVSTSNDGSLAFWAWDVATNRFNPTPYRFIERDKPNNQMHCLTSSPSGIFVATGSTDHFIRVYGIISAANGDAYDKVFEVEAHSDKVDSLQWAHRGLRFVSGSKDGTAKIWSFQRQEWKSKVLNVCFATNTSAYTASTSTEQKGQNNANNGGSNNNSSSQKGNQKSLKITMVGWSYDDVYIVTAVSDHILRQWDATSGTLIRLLCGHKDEAYALEPCPVSPNIMVSAGHDGYLIMWNLGNGEILKKHFNGIEGRGHGAYFDCKYSRDGCTIAAVDSYGLLTIMGISTDAEIKTAPQEQFFHTDFRPIARDANQFVLDEQTQTAPHLMPPPFLVKSIGDPYPPIIQRRVPGRENCSDQFLVPHTVIRTHENDVVEVHDAPPVVQQRSAAAPSLAAQDSGYASSSSPAPPTANANSGSSNSRNNNNNGGNGTVPFCVWVNREIVRALDGRVLDQSILARAEAVEEEMRFYESEKSKPPVSLSIVNNEEETIHPSRHRLRGRRRPATHSYGTREARRAVDPLHSEEELVDPERLQLDQLSDSSDSDYSTNSGRGTSSGSTDSEEDPDADDTPQSQQHSSDEEHSDWAAEHGIRSRHDSPASAQNGNANAASSSSTSKVRATRAERLERRRRRRRLVRRSSDGADAVEAENSEQEEMDAEASIGSSDAEGGDDENSRGSATNTRAASNARKTSAISRIKRTALQRLKERKRVGTTRLVKRHTAAVLDSDGDIDDQPSTSSSQPQQQRRDVRKSTKKSRERPSRSLPKIPAVSGELDHIHPELLKFSEWLTSTELKKFPYFPQSGDQVVYFYQGHQKYVESVELHHVYETDARMLPWIRHGDSIQTEEFCSVTSVKFILKPEPFRLCCLSLAQIDAATGRKTGLTFTVKYHDAPGIIDFIILKQHYDAAMRRRWKPGDRFQSIIDNAWYFGTIDALEPLDPDLPNSKFQSVKVHWDNGDAETVCLWDLEPEDRGKRPSKKGDSIPCSLEDVEALAIYESAVSDWPEQHGKDRETRRLLAGLRCIAQFSLAQRFNAPVDLMEYRDYATLVEYPSDLSTIIARLENGFYRRLSAVKFDCDRIYHNAKRFNLPDSLIVKNARDLHLILRQFLSDPDCDNIAHVRDAIITEGGGVRPRPSTDSDDDFINRSQTSKSQRRRHCSKKMKRRLQDRNDSSRESATASNTRHIERDWKATCSGILRQLTQNENSIPFRRNDSMTSERLYDDESVIDLTLLTERLSSGFYTDPIAFDDDVQLMFNNGKSINSNPRSRAYSMMLRLKAFYEDLFKDTRKAWLSSQQEQQRSQGRRNARNNHEYNTRSARPPMPHPQLRPNLIYSKGRSVAKELPVVSGDFQGTSRSQSSTTKFGVSTKQPKQLKIRRRLQVSPSPTANADSDSELAAAVPSTSTCSSAAVPRLRRSAACRPISYREPNSSDESELAPPVKLNHAQDISASVKQLQNSTLFSCELNASPVVEQSSRDKVKQKAMQKISTQLANRRSTEEEKHAGTNPESTTDTDLPFYDGIVDEDYEPSFESRRSPNAREKRSRAAFVDKQQPTSSRQKQQRSRVRHSSPSSVDMESLPQPVVRNKRALCSDSSFETPPPHSSTGVAAVRKLRGAKNQPISDEEEFEDEFIGPRKDQEKKNKKSKAVVKKELLNDDNADTVNTDVRQNTAEKRATRRSGMRNSHVCYYESSEDESDRKATSSGRKRPRQQ